MLVRESLPQERSTIARLHSSAFGTAEGPIVAGLVEDMLDDETAQPLLSLVALEEDRLKGHILFSRVYIEGCESDVEARILAPLAVSPDVQGRGTGTLLINRGLERLKASGVGLVLVLGHPTYYPRAGFEPAGKHGLEAPYPIPAEHEDAWMVAELQPSMLSRVKGVVRCCSALDRPEHWQE